MAYETIVTVSQTTTLLFFILLFLGVVAYALWPGNREKFKRAANLPLEGGDLEDGNGTR